MPNREPPPTRHLKRVGIGRSTNVIFIAIAVLYNVTGCATTNTNSITTVIQHSVNVVTASQIRELNHGIDRVGILPFSFNRPQSELVGEVSITRPLNAGELVADAITEIPLRLGYVVVDRRQLKILLDENKLSEIDLLKPGTGVKFGQTLGLQAVVLGSVTDYTYWYANTWWGNHVGFTAKLVRLDTGVTLWSTTCVKAGQSSDVELLQALSREVFEQLQSKGAGRQSQ
jgi:hypothetical protein